MKVGEALVVFGTVTLVLMIARLVITKFVSPNWIVSFAIMAATSIVLLVLAKKGKLGWWGQAYLRQMIKNQHGRRAIFFYGTSIVFLAIIIGTIYTIHVGDDAKYSSLKHVLTTKSPEIADGNIMEIKLHSMPPIEIARQIALGLVTLPVFTIENFPLVAVTLSLLNEQLHGMILNIYSASLVEYLELVGMMLFYRLALRNSSVPEPTTVKINLKFKASKQRILLALAFAVIFSITYQAGTLYTIPVQDARTFVEQFKHSVNGINSIGIFLHNITIALPMFVPVFGIIWGSIAGIGTGFAYKAAVTMTPSIAEKIPALALLYLSPFGIMELAAYSIGMSRSLILVNAIRKKQSRHEIRPTIIEIALVVSLLLVAGFIEYYMIKSGNFKT